MDEPKIGERVKFWQEQDRINRELIPRVIKGHELLTRHVESHEDGDSLARAQIEALQTQIVESREVAKTQIEALEPRIIESHEAVKAQIETLETRMIESQDAVDGQIKALEARVTELETQSANQLARWLPYAALTLAVVALVLAIVR